ncbi:MAG TPA: hypothetical protein VKU41_01940 [Polyangiaceae bacterium]|nr:hypothetical protein [Polyangiaceae bacterium]
MGEPALFELELFGEGIERRYRKMRPEVEAMPWGTLSLDGLSPKDLLQARKQWTGAAFQEHRTAIACAATLRVLMEARAPLDLIALGARFPLDELVHVELCSRMAMELGGGTEIVHDPDWLLVDSDPDRRPLVRAADLVVRCFCVGEALSIPLLRGTWKAAAHPLPRAVLGRIVRDEAMHGTFGFAFLDWARSELGDEERRYLASQGDRAIRAIRRQWDAIRAVKPRPVRPNDPIAWMESSAYLALAERSMREKVVRPLLARGIPVTAYPA